MSVNTKMTAIADKIRGLLGLTGTMGLDAMATHLGTEQANITAALTALSDKGVDVPSGANSDDLAELIAAIEAGGGGATVRQGSVTPTASASVVVIPREAAILDEQGPSLVIVYKATSSTNQDVSDGVERFFMCVCVAYDTTVPSGYGTKAGKLIETATFGAGTVHAPYIYSKVTWLASGFKGCYFQTTEAGVTYNYILVFGLDVGEAGSDSEGGAPQ